MAGAPGAGGFAAGRGDEWLLLRDGILVTDVKKPMRKLLLRK
jgi:hypothetical protein